ncbi:hypothetical protein [Telmatospirillum sp.]|uniref:hypothetical protein n=1 Tax=Telmatospirillum sp. TaxID=2079197 RepID=UPI0028468FBD|nr:hypothetical protein [Telmatospirillum sp.]MDR3436929.1 hypothetical protein [Telmatospirillum sp.]
MEVSTIVLVSFVAGLVLVIGAALVVYVGSLVKSAYQIKIQMKSEIEDGQKRQEEELGKQIRWVKRDLVEEIEKSKLALQTDNTRKIAESLEGFVKRLASCEQVLEKERTETAAILQGVRHDLTTLDKRQRQMRRDQKAAAAPAPSEDTGAAAETETGIGDLVLPIVSPAPDATTAQG